MRTTIVVLTLLTLVVSATVASAHPAYTASVQQAWRQEQAAQVRADRQFDKIFSDVQKSMPTAAMPDLTLPSSHAGTGWGAAAGAGARTRGDTPSRVGVWSACPTY